VLWAYQSLNALFQQQRQHGTGTSSQHRRLQGLQQYEAGGLVLKALQQAKVSVLVVTQHLMRLRLMGVQCAVRQQNLPFGNLHRRLQNLLVQRSMADFAVMRTVRFVCALEIRIHGAVFKIYKVV